jgi:hypothetical protein
MIKAWFCFYIVSCKICYRIRNYYFSSDRSCKILITASNFFLFYRSLMSKIIYIYIPIKRWYSKGYAEILFDISIIC